MIRGLISATFLFLNTVFWCVFLYVFALFKYILPVRAWREASSKLTVACAENWISCNNWALGVLQGIRWRISGLEGLKPDRSYFVCANHQSWTDIVVLQKTFNRHIPFCRFFIKQQLAYVPLLGLAWMALDFPRMKRYSKEFLQKHPEKRGEDMATTKKICAKLRGKPVAILNFLEGTRFTPAKHQRQQSPYHHLLKPKVGGIAFALEAMGDQFHALLDVTIYYPRGPVTMWGLLSGGMPEAVVEVQEIPLPKADDRESLQTWIHQLWQRKDERLANRLSTPHP